MSDDIPLVNTKRPTPGDYVRTGSCLGEPQTNAVACLKSRDLHMFTDIINVATEEDEDYAGSPGSKKVGGKLSRDHWINKPLSEEKGLTLLMLAIKSDLPDFVRVLLQAGADAQLLNQDLEYLAPIHVAATCPEESRQRSAAKSLKFLLDFDPKNYADVNVLVKKTGRTALHLCVESKFVEGVSLLLKKSDIQVDVKDKKGGQTPLYLAVKSGQVEVARLLIQHGADIENVCFGKSISKLIEKEMPQLKPESITRLRDVAMPAIGVLDRMKDLIEMAALGSGGRNNPSRLQYFSEFNVLVREANPKNLNEEKFGGETLLLKACQGELHEFVQALVEIGGVDPNATPTGYNLSPILVAAKRGDCATMKVLFKNGADITATSHETGETVLHCLLAQHNQDKSERLQECMRFLLDPDNDRMQNSIKKIVNKRGDMRNTALHHAARLWPAWTVRSLLELGANIGMKNHWDEVPITHIQPETMEEFLNEFCIRFTDKLDVNHDKFELTFDYSFLAPPNEDLPPEIRKFTSKVDVVEETEKGLVVADDITEPQDPDSRYPLPETDSLWYLSQSRNHRHLLKHPVITSFLWLKWMRIRRFFNRNLRFYLLFVFVLTWHIFEAFGGKSIRPSDKDAAIPIFYGIYIAFTVIMILFILRDWKTDVYDKIRSLHYKAKQEKDSGGDNGGGADESGLSCRMLGGIFVSNWMEALLIVFLVVLAIAGKPFLWTALAILVGLLVSRELMQMAVSLKRYVLEVENWIEVATIVLASIILFYNSSEDGLGEDNEDDLRRHLAAIAIVLSWAELITLVGKHPKLNTYNVYVVMFYKVMVTFFFFLIWYAFFIVAFGLAFYIMLHKDVKGGEVVGAESNETKCCDDDYIFFDSPWLSLVKTSTMFVGELEFSDIPVNVESKLSPVSYVFFLSFVFLIVVVLMNLLNGLAVSDTGLIQAKAEIVSYTTQVETISYSESLLLGDPFNFLSNWPAFRWLKNIPPFSIWAPLYRNRFVQSFFNKIFGAKEILLFYSFLPDKTLTCKPNDRKQGCGKCLEIDLMDEKILLSAKSIILNTLSAGKIEQESSETAERIRSLQSEIETLGQKLDLLIQKLG